MNSVNRFLANLIKVRFNRGLDQSKNGARLHGGRSFFFDRGRRERALFSIFQSLADTFRDFERPSVVFIAVGELSTLGRSFFLSRAREVKPRARI